MQHLAQRATTLTPSLTLAIDAKAKKLKADGVDVCGFGAGEPDFDTPQLIKDAAIQALSDGFTKYTPSSGIPELRAAIAEKLKADNGLTYKPSQVIVNCGAKHSCCNAILATCNPGDEVIIPAPYWLSYPEMVKLAGASPVIVETAEAGGFKLAGHHIDGGEGRHSKEMADSVGRPGFTGPLVQYQQHAPRTARQIRRQRIDDGPRAGRRRSQALKE